MRMIGDVPLARGSGRNQAIFIRLDLSLSSMLDNVKSLRSSIVALYLFRQTTLVQR